MSETNKRIRLETEAILLGYAMSRLDREYLTARKVSTWEQAFDEAANSLAKPPLTFKNLRDEFDPVHANPRLGWHNRTMRASRLRVLHEMKEVSDAALLELVDRILMRDEDSVVEAVDALAGLNRVVHNVAERLLTGRRAEEYFLANSSSLIEVATEEIVDLRHSACGFDFGVQRRPEWAIEVKGIKERQGSLQFTDREWSEARMRNANYWVVVVGNLSAQPHVRIIRDPYHSLNVHSRIRRALVVEWHSYISLETA